MRELEKVIFGNLSLLGISYQGEQKDREYKERFSNKNEMKDVMKTTLRQGVRCFAASSHDFNELAPLYLQALKELEKEEAVEVPLIACLGIPLEFRGEKINDFRRWITHLDYESQEFGKEVRARYFEDPILNCRSGWRESLSIAKPYDRKELERELRIDWKRWADGILKFSDYKIAWFEPGSEVDFLAVCRIDLLGELLDKTHELGHRVLLGSHHLGASVPLIEGAKVKKFDGYVTPANKLGVMMFPTQREAENAIKVARNGGKLIAGVKPFGGGRIKPREALEYVYEEVRVDSCMIGVGSVEEAEEGFKIARDYSRNFTNPV